MSKFSEDFMYDDFDDAVDIVLATDRTLDEAIEKAEETADTMDSEDLIKTMQENGDLDYEALTDEDEDLMYNEDEDDAIDIADIDAQDYREAADDDLSEDLDEDDDIDTVIDADPEAENMFFGEDEDI